jgi:mono/diheme cytochrome c family protein
VDGNPGLTRRLIRCFFRISCAFIAAACSFASSLEAAAPDPSADALFTSAQVARGRIVYDSHCSGCHTVSGQAQQAPVELAGREFLSRWRSVNDLYGKVTMTMPADRVLSLTEQQALDVVAYVLARSGLKTGATELGPDRRLMHTMRLATRAMPHTQVRPETGTGYYTVDQARRGKSFFAGSCSTCHIAGAKVRTPGDLSDPILANVSLVDSGGVAMGAIHAKMHLSGPGALDKWANVGDLYKRIKFTMPGHEPAGLDDETYVDIAAYLLELNGYSAGENELSTSTENLGSLPLLPRGYEPIFNGANFSGLRFLIGNGCGQPPQGCGSDTPSGTFFIKDGTIVSRGYPYGYMYTAKKYLNFSLRFDYRFTPNSGAGPEDIYYGNSGYLLFVTKNQVWPKCIEIEGFDVMQLRPLGLATNPIYTYDEDAMKRARRPTGEWNSVEIESRGGQIRSSLNGLLVSVVTQHEFTEPGYIGFQAEDARIAWRNLIVKELAAGH